jgi:hypothetical protein
VPCQASYDTPMCDSAQKPMSPSRYYCGRCPPRLKPPGQHDGSPLSSCLVTGWHTQASLVGGRQRWIDQVVIMSADACRESAECILEQQAGACTGRRTQPDCAHSHLPALCSSSPACPSICGLHATHPHRRHRLHVQPQSLPGQNKSKASPPATITAALASSFTGLTRNLQEMQ